MTRHTHITRKMVIQAIKQGGGVRTIARRLGVSTTFLYCRARKDWRIYNYFVSLRWQYRKHSKKPLSVIHGE